MGGWSWDLADAGFNLFQSIYAISTHQDDLTWNEIDFFNEVRQLRQDMLNNVREEMYDIFERKERVVESNLLVATLMLAIGFGFAVEGTFPDSTKPGGPDQRWPRFFYVVCIALGLCLPFFAMVGFLECRRRMNILMYSFNKQIAKAREDLTWHAQDLMQSETKDIVNHVHDIHSGIPGKEPYPMAHLGKRLKNRLRCCKRSPTKSLKSRTSSSSHKGEGSYVLTIWSAWQDKHVIPVQDNSYALLQVGVGMDLLGAALLLGMYFQTHFKDQPAIWETYSCILGLAVLLLLLLHCAVHRWKCFEPKEVNFEEGFFMFDQVTDIVDEVKEQSAHCKSMGRTVTFVSESLKHGGNLITGEMNEAEKSLLAGSVFDRSVVERLKTDSKKDQATYYAWCLAAKTVLAKRHERSKVVYAKGNRVKIVDRDLRALFGAKIKVGTTGTVEYVWHDGDVDIKFDSLTQKQIVRSKDLTHVAKVEQEGSEGLARSPSKVTRASSSSSCYSQPLLSA
jgi:hypothetical protein